MQKMMLIPELSAPLLRAGPDGGVRDHATHAHGDYDPPPPHNNAPFKTKNDTGTSLWTKNLDDNLLKTLPDHPAQSSEQEFFLYKIQRTTCSNFFTSKSNNLYANFGKK